MKTFLSEIPQGIPMDALVELDPSIGTAVREVAAGAGMPASNSASSILETYAACLTAQMLHDGDDKDAHSKGFIKGLLIGAALSKICTDLVKTTKEGNTP